MKALYSTTFDVFNYFLNIFAIIPFMKKKSLIFASLLLFTSCSSEAHPIVEGNKILYTDSYDTSLFEFNENKNTLTKNKIEDIKNYFLSNGSHMSDDTDYIFLYKGKIQGKEIKIDISYDSSKNELPFYIASTYFQDNKDDRPSRSYFFSCNTDFIQTDNLTENPTSYYDYYYLENRIEKQNSFIIEYSNIKAENHFQIKEANFKIKENETNSKGKQSDEDMSVNALEPIRFLYCYLEKLFNTVSSSYHLID